MKAKITSIAAILIASLIMGGQLVSAQTYEETRPFRAKRIVSKILERAGFGEGIDETTEAGQNMYLRVYKRLREDVNVSAEDLLRPVSGTITAAGLRSNIRIAVLYLSAWLGGNGCVPIDNLMEDAATAEISRSQIWRKHSSTMVGIR